MKVLDLWYKATYRFICHNMNCDECQSFWGIKDICDRTNVTDEETKEFIKSVTDIIKQRMEEETFDWEMSEEEFIETLFRSE